MNFSFSIDISLKPENIFPWIANPDKAILWQKGIKKSKIIKETPERIGTTFNEVIEENGRELEMKGTITGFVENELISFHLESKMHTVNVTYSIRKNKNSSTLKVEGIIKWKFPMSIASLIFGGKMKKNIMKQTKFEFDELKRLCEGKSPAHNKTYK
jgi:hypothetical protein